MYEILPPPLNTPFFQETQNIEDVVIEPVSDLIQQAVLRAYTKLINVKHVHARDLNELIKIHRDQKHAFLFELLDIQKEIVSGDPAAGVRIKTSPLPQNKGFIVFGHLFTDTEGHYVNWIVINGYLAEDNRYEEMGFSLNLSSTGTVTKLFGDVVKGLVEPIEN